MGMPRGLAKIVDEAIRAFQTKHRDAVVADSARTMLVDHARKNERAILADLRQRKTTEKGLTKGLEEVLGHATKLQKPRRVKAVPMYEGVAAHRTSPRVRPPKKVRLELEISPRSVRAAMKKKCKTFPWC